MKRLKLFLSMAALAGLAALTVKIGSPYRPVVEPVREIEEIWAIEDEREESVEPLVTRLFCNGAELAYDAESNTFYCTLGLENGAEWPEIKLTADETAGRGLCLCFADDYSYDECDTAIREGYSYQIFAYTDDAYSYSDIVYTGLPILTLTTQEEIGEEDAGGSFTYSSYDGGALTGGMRVHLRGDGSLRWLDKKGYRVEFTRTTDGKKKIRRDVPGFCETDTVLLLAMGFDETLMRDRLSWDMAALVWPADEAFSARTTAYAEVFINGEYMGAYLMMTPYHYQDELNMDSPTAAAQDSLYRTVVSQMVRDRQEQDGFELFWAPDEAKPFEGLQAYLDMKNAEDDRQV